MKKLLLLEIVKSLTLKNVPIKSFLGFLQTFDWSTDKCIFTMLQYYNVTCYNIELKKIRHFRARVSQLVLGLRSGCTLALGSSEPQTREVATTISSDAARWEENTFKMSDNFI